MHNKDESDTNSNLVKELVIDYEDFTIVPFDPKNYFYMVDVESYSEKVTNFRDKFHKVSSKITKEIENNFINLDDTLILYLNTFEEYSKMLENFKKILTAAYLVKETVDTTFDDLMANIERQKSEKDLRLIYELLRQILKKHRKFMEEKNLMTEETNSEAQKKIYKNNFEKNIEAHKNYTKFALSIIKKYDLRENEFVSELESEIKQNTRFLLNFMMKAIEKNIFNDYTIKSSYYLDYIQEFHKLHEFDDLIFSNFRQKLRNCYFEKISKFQDKDFKSKNYKSNFSDSESNFIELELINLSLKIISTISNLNKTITDSGNLKFFKNEKNVLNIIFEEFRNIFFKSTQKKSAMFNIFSVREEVNTEDMGRLYVKRAAVAKVKNNKKRRMNLENIQNLIKVNKISIEKLNNFKLKKKSNISLNLEDFENLELNCNFEAREFGNLHKKFLEKNIEFTTYEIKSKLEDADKILGSFVIKTMTSTHLCETDDATNHLYFFKKFQEKISPYKGSLYFLNYKKHFTNILDGIKMRYNPLQLEKNIIIYEKDLLPEDKLVNIVSTIITVSDLLHILKKIRKEKILLTDEGHNKLMNDYQEFGFFLRKKYREKIFCLIYFHLEIFYKRGGDSKEFQLKTKSNVLELKKSFEMLRLWDRKTFRRKNKNENILIDEFYGINCQFEKTEKTVKKITEKRENFVKTTTKINKTTKNKSKRKKYIKKIFNTNFDKFYLEFFFKRSIEEFKFTKNFCENKDQIKKLVGALKNVEQIVNVLLLSDDNLYTEISLNSYKEIIIDLERKYN